MWQRIDGKKMCQDIRALALPLAAAAAAADAPLTLLLVALRSGLAARLPLGDCCGLADMRSLSFCFLRVPSLPSPPDISLPDPASARARLLFRCSGAVEGGRWGADEAGAYSGDRGLEGGLIVVELIGGARCCFFTFFLERADSLPLASEAFGEPARLRLLEEATFLRPPLACLLGLPDGVFAPEGLLDALPALLFSRSDALPFLSSAFFFSSSLRRSASVPSSSL